ncbi:MAG TPA: hypothetical protein VK846_19195 [Candidatus Limnocylindria bacterium]|nr:hypothetical protein [Candidatus Limnocylindria bacterium]
MKTYLLTLLALTILATALQAELIVYRESERAHVTGAGVEATVPVTTYIVYNTVSQSIDSIGAIKFGSTKIYAITNSSSYKVTRGIAGKSGNYTVLSRIEGPAENPETISASYFAKGRESTLPLGNGNTATYPRSLKAITRAVQTSGGQLATYESSSTVVFQATETKTANEAGDTAADVIERIRLRLENQGYVPAS